MFPMLLRVPWVKPAGILAAILAVLPAARAENWPAWRGPRMDGTSHEENVPVHWNATSNVVWKTALPGVGHASPIVWENHLFTVTAGLDSQILGETEILGQVRRAYESRPLS